MWVAFFGILAFVLHLVAYVMYAQQVLAEKVKPNVATWLMWLFGGIVEWQTYDHMTDSHWSSSLLPLACVLGLVAITLATIVSQVRERWRGTGRVIYHKPKLHDWAFVSFDVMALAIWLWFDLAELANTIAVGTTIVTFIPIWRTTWQEPESERPTMWLIWCTAYMCMLAAVLLRGSDNLLWQSFYPLYFFALHAVVAVLAFRDTQPKQHKTQPMPAE